MAGLYLHIPFCKSACYYCDFHFSVNQSQKDNFVNALLTEIELRAHELKNEVLETIYFGGGTPSVLSIFQINSIVNKIFECFPNRQIKEITFESNPEDLNETYFKQLENDTPITRLSIGVQSFEESHLYWMNRPYDINALKTTLSKLPSSKFKNTTIDLIYGFELMTDEQWLNNLQTAINFGINHLSCYSMTLEKRTVFNKKYKNQVDFVQNDAKSESQFLLMIDFLESNNFQHYEISNFAIPGCEAIHNFNYWKGVSYIGFGPSAHSFDGESIRKINPANNSIYLHSLTNLNTPCFEIEHLSINDQINEYILTQLRLNTGLNFEKFETRFGAVAFQKLYSKIDKISTNWISEKEKNLILNKEGKLWLDTICLELIF